MNQCHGSVYEKNYATQYIGKIVEVTMDRPLHSKHQKFAWEYTLNYGYVPGTHAPDGEEIDAYILRVNQPLVPHPPIKL